MQACPEGSERVRNGTHPGPPEDLQSLAMARVENTAAKVAPTAMTGGTRSRGASSRLRPLKPRETIGMRPPFGVPHHARVIDRQARRLLPMLIPEEVR